MGVIYIVMVQLYCQVHVSEHRLNAFNVHNMIKPEASAYMT